MLIVGQRNGTADLHQLPGNIFASGALYFAVSAVAARPEDYRFCGFAQGQSDLRGQPRSRHGRRSRRKAIISSLIRVLLEETGSPPESEEEAEM